ncbi:MULTISPECIES: thiol reductant ABC exporter subunit CydD [Acetobacter]|jgi:ATP-binding cassette subfamily C protein CydD|uniref:ATP-binding cassette subfamily C protein CydD n=3 Tax=Acetobacteraceae TaxID=433 RepID=A0A841QG15_9PROT|nr:thiol reductant ABC exporter subunit CydD [Acetobacter lovaniensis]MBB6457396.1 ATP-binding cassette subfamily C protein CydD [Acetobacter lovaniensis]
MDATPARSDGADMTKGLARQVRGWLLGSVVCGGVSAVLLVCQFILLAHLVDDLAFHGRGLGTEISVFGLILACLVGQVGARFASDIMGTQAGLRVAGHVRGRLLTHLLAAGPVVCAGVPAGEIVTTFTEGARALVPYFARYVPSAAMMVVLPLLILAVVAGVDGWSFVVLACTGPLVPVFMVFVGYGAQTIMDRRWRELSLLGGSFLDALRGLKTLRLFGRTQDSLDRITRLAEAHGRTTLSVMKVAFLTSASLEFFSSLSIALVAVVFGTRLLAGTADFRSAFLVLLLAPEYFMPLRTFSASYHARQNARAAMEHMGKLFALPAQAGRYGMQTPQPVGSVGALACTGLEVHTPDGTTVLQHVTCHFARNRLTVLTGASGAGKTTLLNTLLGFLQPVAGRLEAYDTSGRPMALDGVRMAWVPQHPLMIFGTVADNLRLGVTGADMQQLRQAAELADALGFIEALPDGFETHIGERGSRLSGGQVRRLALARALLQNPDVLVLDEPTAGLDVVSALHVANALRRCVAGRIVVVATHRQALADRADVLLHVAGGTVESLPVQKETVA